MTRRAPDDQEVAPDVNHPADALISQNNRPASTVGNDKLTSGEQETSQDAAPEQTVEGSDRPKRVRRQPIRLGDYETNGATVNSVSVRNKENCCQSIDKTTSERMAQRQLQERQLGPVLEIHEDGELSEGESVESVEGETMQPVQENKENVITLTGTTKDHTYVSDKTVNLVSFQFRQSRPYGSCIVKGCRYSTTASDRLQIHIEQHHVVYARKCGFISSNRDSVLKHGRKKHSGSKSRIIQCDRYNWNQVRHLVSGLPAECPALPMAHKPPHVECRPVPNKRKTDHPAPAGDLGRDTLALGPGPRITIRRVDVDPELDEETAAIDGSEGDRAPGSSETNNDQVNALNPEPNTDTMDVYDSEDGSGRASLADIMTIPRLTPSLGQHSLALRRRIQEKTERARMLRQIAAEVDLEADQLREELARLETQ
jgi:hypothetical protein